MLNKLSSRLALFGLTATMTSVVAATGWSQGSDSWIALTELTLDRENYSRSAPDERAAFHVSSERTLAATNAADSAEIPEIDPELGLTARRRDELKIWGPWLSSTGVSDNARQLVNFIENIDHHGLSGNAYGLSMLKSDIAKRERAATIAIFDAAGARNKQFSDAQDAEGLAAQTKVSLNDADQEGVRLDRLLDSTLARVATHIGQGTVDPRKTQYRMYRDAPEVDIDALRSQVNTGVLDVNNALLSVMPTHPDYLRLVDHMEDLLEERATGVQRTHVPEVGTLWVGHHHADVMKIKRRLTETGEMQEDATLTPMFDADLKLAIMAFQERHAIPSSGIVDLRTRNRLNTNVDDAIADAAISLERWRWMPRDLGDRHLFMNIPSYRLKMVDAGEEIMDMNVVVGATKFPTPTFTRDMTYIELNPTWTVPASIAHNELLPRELKNPGYLRTRNFDFLRYTSDGFKIVDYDSVTPEDMRRRPFRYTIRQRAGRNNALGRMKFMMPNQYAIYFHDTQAKRYFTLPDRAYSHGCIRISDPDEMLRTLLETDGRSRSYINRALAKRKTSHVVLRTPVKSHLAYFTTRIDEAGDLRSYSDVYKHDDGLEDALRAAGTLLTDIENSAVTASANRHAASPAGPADQV